MVQGSEYYFYDENMIKAVPGDWLVEVDISRCAPPRAGTDPGFW